MAIPALSTRQMVEVDRLMSEEFHISLLQMMENAGRNLAEQACRMLGSPVSRVTARGQALGTARGQASGRVVVLCGAGHNGGGGMAAARHLHSRGVDVQAYLVADASRLKDAPARQWRSLQAIGLARDGEPDLARADLLLDALIGYGLTGNPRGAAAQWIERANAAGRPILALDAPSGLDTTTGAAGVPCIRAAATLTLALPKAGLLATGAREFVGALYLADIGVPPELYARLGLSVGTPFAADSIVEVARPD